MKIYLGQNFSFLQCIFCVLLFNPWEIDKFYTVRITLWHNFLTFKIVSFYPNNVLLWNHISSISLYAQSVVKKNVGLHCYFNISNKTWYLGYSPQDWYSQNTSALFPFICVMSVNIPDWVEMMRGSTNVLAVVRRFGEDAILEELQACSCLLHAMFHDFLPDFCMQDKLIYCSYLKWAWFTKMQMM